MGRLANRMFVVVGGIVTLGGAWVAGSAGTVLLRAPATPPVVALAEAPDRSYLRVAGAVLDCETRAIRDGTTVVLGSDAAGRHPFLAQLLGEIPCGQIALEGSFLPGKYTRAFARDRLRVNLPEGEDLRLFTEALSPRYQRSVLKRTVPWLAFGILLLALGIRGLRGGA